TSRQSSSASYVSSSLIVTHAAPTDFSTLSLHDALPISICGSSPPSDLGAFVRLVRIASTPEDSDETATQPRGDVSDPVHGRGPQPAGGAYIDSSRGSATADRPTER